MQNDYNKGVIFTASPAYKWIADVFSIMCTGAASRDRETRERELARERLRERGEAHPLYELLDLDDDLLDDDGMDDMFSLDIPEREVMGLLDPVVTHLKWHSTFFSEKIFFGFNGKVIVKKYVIQSFRLHW